MAFSLFSELYTHYIQNIFISLTKKSLTHLRQAPTPISRPPSPR